MPQRLFRAPAATTWRMRSRECARRQCPKGGVGGSTAVSHDPIGPRRSSCTFCSWMWLLSELGSRAAGEECGWAAAPALGHSLQSLTRSTVAARPATSQCGRTNPVACMTRLGSKAVSFPRSRKCSVSLSHAHSSEHRSIDQTKREGKTEYKRRAGNFFSLDTTAGLYILNLSIYSCCRRASDAGHQSEGIRWEEDGVSYRESGELLHRRRRSPVRGCG